MIKSLQIKLIAVSMCSLFIVLALIAGTINFINYSTIRSNADNILQILSENNGLFPPPDRFGKNGKNSLSREIPFESRYFTVSTDNSGNILEINTDFTITVDETAAKEYVSDVILSGKKSGFYENFRYTVAESDDKTLYIFLDCGRELERFEDFLITSVVVSLIGLIAVFILMLMISSYVVRPISKGYENQKRFITDAGHELKTPLTIINSDAEILEMDYGQNEWIDDIKLQVSRLTSLTNDLVFLAKMEEKTLPLNYEKINLSELLPEAVSSFEAPSRLQNKNIRYDIEKDIFIKADKKSILQLINLLMDNAVKYSPPQSTVTVRLKIQNSSKFTGSLSPHKKKVRLSVYNETVHELDSNISDIFERFYRMDKSRNSETGGHGIGLSVAKAISEAHGGSISAATSDGHSIEVFVKLPVYSE